MKKYFRTLISGRNIARISGIALAAALTLTASACTANTPGTSGTGSQASDSTGSTAGEAVTIKVGATPVPHAEILEKVKEILAEENIILEIVEYTDYVQPNNALRSGDLDANYFQHQPFLDNYNAENNSDLKGVVKIHFEPLSIYKSKVTDLADLPDGAKIGVPNDTTNEARALHLLEAAGLIDVDDEAGLEATINDIVSNDKNLEIVETAAESLTNLLPSFDVAVINGNYALTAGLTADDILASEGTDSAAANEFGNVLAVQNGDENRPEIAALIEAITSDEIAQFIEEEYQGAVIPLN